MKQILQRLLIGLGGFFFFSVLLWLYTGNSLWKEISDGGDPRAFFLFSFHAVWISVFVGWVFSLNEKIKP